MKLPKSKLIQIQKSVSDDLEIEKSKVSVIVQRDRIKLSPMVMVFQTFAYLAATKLKPATNRLIMLLLSKSYYENYVGMDVKTICEELGITRQSVVSSINELVDNNIVIKLKHPTDNRRHDYFINPLAMWKGNGYTRAQAIKKIDKKQLDLFPEEEPAKLIEGNVNS